VIDLTHIAADLRGLAVQLTDLVPSPTNARQHKDADLAVLCESLRAHGQQKPVVAYRPTHEVIAGNGTLLAAQRLDWTHLAVVWFDGTPEEARAYALRDNRTAELSEWNLEELARQLRAVHASEGEEGVTALGWLPHEAQPLILSDWQPEAVETLPGQDVQWRGVRFTLDQWLVVGQGVERVRASEGDAEISEERAIELIVADYLAGHAPADEQSG
jgi:hypothetical protein